MKPQNFKIVQLVADMTVDNGAFTTAEIDTAGFEYCTILASFGNVPANVSAMTVTESDTAGSGHSAFITVGTTAAIDGVTSALPTAAGGDGKTLAFEVDMKGRKRYLDLTCTAGNGSGTATEMSAVALLFNGDLSVETEAERGADQIIRA